MGEILLLAVGIALSPFPVVPAVLLLFSEHPRSTSLAFLGGWAGSVATVTAVFVLVSGLVGSAGAPPAWLSWVRVAAGVALVVLGVRQWLTRRTAGEPAWMQSLQDATPRTAVRLALLLSAANPKIVLLAAAGGIDIGNADLTTASAVGAGLVFTAVASLSVAVPVLSYAVAGEAVLPPMERAKSWLTANGAAVMAVVIVVIGLVLLKNGVAGL